MPLIHQYVTKGGGVIDSPADQFGSVQTAAAAAAKLLELGDKEVVLVDTVSGGVVAVRVGQIDHIAAEKIDPQK